MFFFFIDVLEMVTLPDGITYQTESISVMNVLIISTEGTFMLLSLFLILNKPKKAQQPGKKPGTC